MKVTFHDRRNHRRRLRHRTPTPSWLLPTWLRPAVPQSAISVHAKAPGTMADDDRLPRARQGFWASLFGGEPDHDTAVYDRSMDSGSTVVTVKAPESAHRQGHGDPGEPQADRHRRAGDKLRHDADDHAVADAAPAEALATDATAAHRRCRRPTASCSCPRRAWRSASAW